MICGACGKDLPENAFYKHSRNKSGFDSKCKECSLSRVSFVGVPKPCKLCGKSFIRTSENSRYCPDCANLSKTLKRKLSRKKEESVDNFCETCKFQEDCQSCLWDYGFEFPCFKCSPLHQQWVELSEQALICNLSGGN